MDLEHPWSRVAAPSLHLKPMLAMLTLDMTPVPMACTGPTLTDEALAILEDQASRSHCCCYQVLCHSTASATA